MKIFALLLGLGLILIQGVALAQDAFVSPQSVAVEDADTLLVELDGRTYRVQLVDIDAPESVPNPKLQRDVERTGLDSAALLALGQAADAALTGLLAEFRPYRLSFQPEAPDRYGRIPGELYAADGRALSTELVARGYAIPLPGRPEPAASPLERALEIARSNRLGLWASEAPAFAAWAGMTAGRP